MSEFARLDKRK